MIQYQPANPILLEQIWNNNIAAHPDDPRWKEWKKSMLRHNASGKATTFLVLSNGAPVGEGTLLYSPECEAIGGRTELADGRSTANINALRIQKEFEGQGHISALVKLMEKYAVQNGYTALTIGVEARETRNLAIYLHWGYCELVSHAIEDGELVLYYRKKLERA